MKTVKILSECSSQNGTSLVTIFMPNTDNNSKNLMISKLNYEISTANNIKSKLVRKDVLSSLKSAIYNIKNYNNINENGIVICSGIVKPTTSCL